MPERSVVVVGGGLAGFAAALAAAAEGARVVLIWRAPGATSLYAGAMEIAPPLEAFAALPEHPLNRLGLDGPGVAAELEDATSWLAATLGRAGLPLRGGSRERGT